MLKGEKDGVMITKPGCLTIGNTKYGQMISGFCRKVDKNCALLGYYVHYSLHSNPEETRRAQFLWSDESSFMLFQT